MQSDYWCSRSLVITVEGPGGRQRVEVDKPFARLGSHDLPEVLIPDKGISRRRLYFHATDDGVFCVDLAHIESATSPRGWLRMDDSIKLGPYRIWAQLGSPAASDVWPQRETMADLEAKETAAEPQPVLVMSIKGKEVARRYLTRQLTVLGRRSPSTLRITSHSVSASHCVLYWKSDVLWVVDLFSGNGTRLQGRPIDVARISPGESLKIGPAELHLVDMFEKLPNGNEVEPAEIIEGREAHDNVDDGQGGEIDDSSPEMAESPALARQRDALERQSSDLKAARDKLRKKKEAWRSRCQNEEHSLKGRARQLEEASSLLAADRDEFNRLREEHEEEHGKTDERLKELALELADQQTGLQSQRQTRETKRQEDENALGARSEELDKTDERLKELAQELADQQTDLQSQRQTWETKRQEDENALGARSEELDKTDERLKELALELANQQTGLQSQRQTRETKRQEDENALGARSEELDKTDERLKELALELADQQTDLQSQRQTWETERQEDENALGARSEELGKTDERLKELALELADQQTDLQSQRQTWETKRQEDENALGARSEELDKTDERLKELALELADQQTDLQSQRQTWETKRQEDENALGARSEELDKTDERLKELALELADQQTDLQSQRQTWETKRQEDENALGARSEKLDKTDERLKELALELADQQTGLQSQRQTWETERQEDENALGARTEELDQISAALADEREQFEAQRKAWGEERLRQPPAHHPPSGQSTPVKAEASSPARPAADDTPQVSRRLEELRQERNQSRSNQESLGTGPAESSALTNLDGSPRFASLTTIRRGPRWAPANRTDGLGSTVTAFWAGVMIVAVAFSGITGAAVWFHLRPAYTITIQTAAVDENGVVEPEADSNLGARPPGFDFPEDVVKSAGVLSEVVKKIDLVTLAEINPRSDWSECMTWLRDELKVSYSEETRRVRIGLSGTQVSDLPEIVDTVGEAFMAELNLPASARVASEGIDGWYRLMMTILGTVVGLFVPIVFAIRLDRRRGAAGKAQFRQDLG